VRPAFQAVNALSSYVQNGGTLLVAGQYIANEFQGTAFLTNTLMATFVEDNTTTFYLSADPASYATGINISLYHNNSVNAHYSVNSITAVSGGNVLFTDGQGKTKGVYGTVGSGKIVFMDFNLSSINNVTVQNATINATLMWFDNYNVSENENTVEGIPPFKVNIYPNPVKSSVNIDILSSKRGVSKPTYSVFNIKGQQVQSGELNGANNKIDLNISSGIYFINVADEKQQTTRKVLIIK
jgi:hypothetical protein